MYVWDRADRAQLARRCGELLVSLHCLRYGVLLLLPLLRRPCFDGECVYVFEQSRLCDCVVDESVAVEQLHTNEAVGGDEEVELAAL